MNPLDALIKALAPRLALKRQRARHTLAYYEGAKPSRVRKFYTGNPSPNAQVRQSAVALRTQARQLTQNYDLARGALRVLVNNVVGPHGIAIEPQPRHTDGSIHQEYADALLAAWHEWTKRPEVSHRHHWASVQRMMAWSWLRDGEVFAKKLLGPIKGLAHGSPVPFSLEMIEADFLPMDMTDPDQSLVQGIQVNNWGQALAYHFLKRYPSGDDSKKGGKDKELDVKRVKADNVIHLALRDRIEQARGVSAFASVITRLADTKDYDESERIAAKIAAKLTAYVKRGNPELFDPAQMPGGEPREIPFEAGMIIDTLGVGEDIGLIDSKRPNANFGEYRNENMRAFAAGLGASHSSVSKRYDGTYSAQRQELVEQWVHYGVLADEFIGSFIRPVWEQFVLSAETSSVPRPGNVKKGTGDSASFIGQSMPWIDPVKEANAWTELVKAGFASEIEVIRRRGGNPIDVLNQIQRFRQEAEARGLQFTTELTPTERNNG